MAAFLQHLVASSVFEFSHNQMVNCKLKQKIQKQMIKNFCKSKQKCLKVTITHYVK